MMPRKPSYKDIAERLGVSQMTVSLALRSHPSIPDATRAKVLQAAREIGYARDPEIARLMNYIRDRSQTPQYMTVAVLNFWPDKHYLSRSTYTRSFMEGMRERATELGFQPEVFWVKESGVSQKRIFEILEARGVRHVLLPTAPPGSVPLSVDLSGFTVLAASRVWEAMKLNNIFPNHQAEIRLAIAKIQEAGYRRIGFVIDEETDNHSDQQWLSSYLHFWFRTSHKDRVSPLAIRVITPSKLKAWLAKESPEVVLSPLNSISAMMEKIGFRIPRDMSFVTLNWTETVRNFTGVSLNPRQVGIVAMDVLSACSTMNQCGIPKNRFNVQVEPFWVDGGTFKTTGM